MYDKGRNLITGLPDEMEITTEEIRNAIKEPIETIVGCVNWVLEKTPPELSSDIVERGISNDWWRSANTRVRQADRI